MTAYGPRVLWDNVSRWVDAGRYVTSAGVSAGTDMAFHLVDRLAGRAVAEVAAILDAESRRPDRNPDLQADLLQLGRDIAALAERLERKAES